MYLTMEKPKLGDWKKLGNQVIYFYQKALFKISQLQFINIETKDQMDYQIDLKNIGLLKILNQILIFIEQDEQTIISKLDKRSLTKEVFYKIFRRDMLSNLSIILKRTSFIAIRLAAFNISLSNLSKQYGINTFNKYGDFIILQKNQLIRYGSGVKLYPNYYLWKRPNRKIFKLLDQKIIQDHQTNAQQDKYQLKTIKYLLIKKPRYIPIQDRPERKLMIYNQTLNQDDTLMDSIKECIDQIIYNCLSFVQ